MSTLALLAIPTTAGAYATVAPPPTAGSPGLPDGRLYEQVSPPDKNGNSAGNPFGVTPPVMLAEAAGDGVAYSDSVGSIGDTKNGAQLFTVAKRASAGWVNAGAQPLGIDEQALLLMTPRELAFSADLTRVLFRAHEEYLPQAPQYSALLYDIPDGSLTWLNPPLASPTYTEEEEAPTAVAGFSADMSTIYFRQNKAAPNAGFYEYHDGVESVAGVLPDGSVAPGAVAAGLPRVQTPDYSDIVGPNELRNQVSEDGTRAFFAAGSPTELYVRETAPDGTQSTVLVSEDSLLPDVGGLPAPAPGGVLTIGFPRESIEGEALSSPESREASEGYLYASPDGSRAFFESTDALTGAAREAEEHGLPAGDAKEYMFDTQTGALTYLPGVADAPEVKGTFGELYGPSPILVSSRDGSRFLFNGPGGLSLWSEVGPPTPEGGTVTPIEPFPVGGEARATPDGSVFVLESAAPLAGFNNGGSHLAGQFRNEGPFRNQEIYRYDVAEGALSCVSCPPAGIVPSGNAYLSHDFSSKDIAFGLLSKNDGISEDGSRVFFDTPDPLVPQDVNTGPFTKAPQGEYVEHGRDVYEWENGSIFLISTGTSGEDSYVGDNSASGNDVFFSTNQGLAPGDTDGGYDVYDARVPRPGDHPPPPPAACEGDVCQGPPSVPVLLGAPASATFNGLGNLTPEPVSAPAAKPKPKSKAKGCKKGFVKKKNKCVKKPKAKKSAKGRK